MQPTMSREELVERLREIGRDLPPSPAPALGLYRPVRINGNHLHTSALGPFKTDGDGFAYVGEIGTDLTTDEAREAAALTGLHLLNVIDDRIGIGRITGLCELVIHVRAADDFTEHARVADGISEVLIAALGEDAGSHARTVVGANSLPLAIPIVASLTAAMEGSP